MSPAESWDLTTVDSLLTRTRSVRLHLDLESPVDMSVILECLRIALQAPNGGNQQYWRWILVMNPEQRARIGDFYRHANGEYEAYLTAQAEAGNDDASRALRSSSVLWQRLGDVPALLFACYERPNWFDDSNYARASVFGSVFPAVWSFQLACRSRGIGTCLVTSHLHSEREIGEILKPPANFGQAAMVAIAYLTGGSQQAAPRGPIEDVLRLDSWS